MHNLHTHIQQLEQKLKFLNELYGLHPVEYVTPEQLREIASNHNINFVDCCRIVRQLTTDRLLVTMDLHNGKLRELAFGPNTNANIVYVVR